MIRFETAFVSVCLLAGTAAGGDTWYVDDDAAPGGNGSQAAPFQDIGDAFGVAAAGDTILVADGLYRGSENRNLAFTDGPLTVRSLNGASNCVVDCEGLGRGFRLHNADSDQPGRLEGFTIRNGDSKDSFDFSNGGGVYLRGNVEARDLSIVDCVSISGGGMHARYLNTVEGPVAVPLIADCTFRGCSASFAGALVFHAGVSESQRLADCVFEDNYGNVEAGALAALGPIDVLRCRFSTNLSPLGVGGAISVQGSARISHSIFSANTARGAGAVQTKSGPVAWSNCLFAGNVATQLNGGALAGNGEWTVSQCTFAMNRAAGGRGGAIHHYFDDKLELTNSVLWGNEADEGNQLSLGNSQQSTSAAVLFSTLEGGEAGVFVESGSILLWGPGNLDADPLFRDPSAGDFRLTAQSPAVDTGDNGLALADVLDVDGDGDVFEKTPLDLAGQRRFAAFPLAFQRVLHAQPSSDMGAFEVQ